VLNDIFPSRGATMTTRKLILNDEDGLTPFDGILTTGTGRYVGFVRGSAQLTPRGWEGRLHYSRDVEAALGEPNPFRLELRGGETMAISIALFGLDGHDNLGTAAFVHGAELEPKTCD
jgi:hypothetical protein